MRKVFSYLVVLTMFLTMMGIANAAIQTTTPRQDPGVTPAEMTFQGTLVSVDSTNHMLTVKGSNNKDMTFSYTDSTQITGPEKTIEGLAGKSGSSVSVTYKESDGANLATRVHISE